MGRKGLGWEENNEVVLLDFKILISLY